MKVSDVLQHIKQAKGSIAKKEILLAHAENMNLKKALLYGLDNFTPFNIVKVPKVKNRLEFPLSEDAGWQEFFKVADECSSRSVTGNAAIDRVYTCFSSVSEEDEMWMRKILNKHLAIGASTKTVNSVFPGLIPTFDVSLAQKFDMKRIKGKQSVVVEPKLDGIRCFAIVENGVARMFARSGKIISNFDNTIGKELIKVGDGCYDGELMGEDFIALMRQAYRKDDVDTGGTYLALFDYLPLKEWHTRETKMSCHDRYEKLLDMLSDSEANLDLVQPVEREDCDVDYDEIKSYHDSYVSMGYEGAMIKDPDAPYRFGRGYEVMKLKAFHDVDLKIESLEEGTGKHAGKLGSVVVSFNGVDVRVGSGFSDDVRESVWADKQAFVGRMIEVRYQEVTPDGSLRFPTFVCFRNDR
tara:strand:- start:461 stop:1693 length:1233 start_codon:yes stop_codon:yes gene_type:complete